MTINFENSPDFTLVKDSAHLAELLNAKFEPVTNLDTVYFMCRKDAVIWALNPRTGKPTRAKVTMGCRGYGDPVNRLLMGLKFDNGHYDTFDEWDLKRGRILRIVG